MPPGEELKGTQKKLSAYTAQLEQALAAARHENQALLAQIVHLKKALSAREQRERSLQASKARVSQAVTRLKLRNAELLNSTSWRATSPIRAAVGTCRKFTNVLRKAMRRDPKKIITPEADTFSREGFIDPSSSRFRWSLEGSALTFRHPALDVFWIMPEGFQMPSCSILSLAEFLLLHPFGEEVEVVPRPSARGERVAVAFSGGIDSAAALRLLPDPIPIYSQVAQPGDLHILDNALLAVEEVNGVSVKTNYDDLARQFDKKKGYYGFGVFTITSVLLSDHYGVKTIADGNIIDTVYLYSEDGHGTRFNKGDYSKTMEAFERAGLQYCLPCAGLSEVSTVKIAGDLKYAMGCMRGRNGRPCQNCMKCYRKEALRGAPIPPCAESEIILSKPVIPLLGALLWANQNRGLGHPILNSISKDISWVDKWYRRSIEFIPTELREHFLKKLEEFGIPPLEDEAALHQWSAEAS